MSFPRLPLLPLLLTTLLGACADEELGDSDVTVTESPVIMNYFPWTTSTSWSSLPPTAIGSPAAAAGGPAGVYFFGRGDGTDATLKISLWLSNSYTMPGSPTNIAADAPSATYDPVSQKLFVVARTTGSKVYLAESGVNASGNTTGWTWTDLGSTSLAPSVAVGCGRVQVGSSYNGELWAWSRSAASAGLGAWTRLTGYGTGVGLPAMAANVNGAVAMAGRGSDGKVRLAYADCGGVNDGRWTTPVALGNRTTNSSRVGLGALGPLFGVSIFGTDGRPYFILQTIGLLGAQWPSSFELVEARQIIEAPTVTVFRGTIILGGRDGGQATRYWVRNPNTLAYRSNPTMWIGGRVMGGWGTGSMPPVFAAAGKYSLNGPTSWGQSGVVSDLYVATRGIGDRKLYYLNFSRSMAIDLLENHFKMTIDTSRNGNEAKADTDNLFELFLGVLRAPTRFWPTLANVASGDHQPNVCNLDSQTGARIYPTPGGATGFAVMVNCEPTPRIEYGFQMEDFASAPRVWEEVGHVTADTNKSITMSSAYTTAFNDTGFKLCTLSSQCGTGGVCYNDGNIKMCRMTDTGFGYRPRGFALDYQATSADHNYIYSVLMYRYFGDDLRTMVALDKTAGDTRMEKKYAYVRDQVYGGVEFNGRRATSNSSATSDETRGGFAMPLK